MCLAIGLQVCYAFKIDARTFLLSMYFNFQVMTKELKDIMYLKMVQKCHGCQIG